MKIVGVRAGGERGNRECLARHGLNWDLLVEMCSARTGSRTRLVYGALRHSS